MAEAFIKALCYVAIKRVTTWPMFLLSCGQIRGPLQLITFWQAFFAVKKLRSKKQSKNKLQYNTTHVAVHRQNYQAAKNSFIHICLRQEDENCLMTKKKKTVFVTRQGTITKLYCVTTSPCDESSLQVFTASLLSKSS